MIQRIGIIGLLIALSCIGINTNSYAYDRHVLIINQTSNNMIGLYASNVGANTWQENILRGRQLRSGGQFVVNIDDGTTYCHYDLRAVFSDGSKAERHNLDVCTVETWTVYENE